MISFKLPERDSYDKVPALASHYSAMVRFWPDSKTPMFVSYIGEQFEEYSFKMTDASTITYYSKLPNSDKMQYVVNSRVNDFKLGNRQEFM